MTLPTETRNDMGVLCPVNHDSYSNYQVLHVVIIPDFLHNTLAHDDASLHHSDYCGILVSKSKNMEQSYFDHCTLAVTLALTITIQPFCIAL